MSTNNNGSKKKQSNTGRQFEIDLIKAVAIIMMITCHVFDIMTTAGEGDDLLKHTIYFLGNTSAGLFIFCMGIGVVFTTHCSPAAFAKRGIRLLAQGYVLNFFVSFLPSLIGFGFNIEALAKSGELYGVFTTDILQYAGLTFLLIALLKKLKFRPWGIMALAIVFQLVITFLDGAFDNSPLAVRYLLGLLIYTGSPLISMYPLFVFFIYTASGILFGELLKRTENKRTFYVKSAMIGAAIFVAASFIYRFIAFDITAYYLTDSYYSNILPAAIWYIGQIGIWAALSYLVSFIVKGRARKVTEFFSRNITNIYVIQWIIIIPMRMVISIVADRLLSPLAGLPLSVTVIILTIFLSKLWNKRRKRIQ